VEISFCLKQLVVDGNRNNRAVHDGSALRGLRVIELRDVENSQYGKIIRMDSSTIRESGRSAQGVRLLHVEAGDRVAAAVVIPPDEEPNRGLIQ
jgi:DNA gyrase/topoisomerase IV subunit A